MIRPSEIFVAKDERRGGGNRLEPPPSFVIPFPFPFSKRRSHIPGFPPTLLARRRAHNLIDCHRSSLRPQWGWLLTRAPHHVSSPPFFSSTFSFFSRDADLAFFFFYTWHGRIVLATLEGKRERGIKTGRLESRRCGKEWRRGKGLFLLLLLSPSRVVSSLLVFWCMCGGALGPSGGVMTAAAPAPRSSLLPQAQ